MFHAKEEILKKRAATLFALALLVAGCVAQKPAVNVDENQIHFNMPKMTLELDDAYIYENVGRDRHFSFFDDGGTTGTGISSERHLFYSIASGDEHLILVVYSTLTRAYTEFRPVSFDHENGLLQKGEEVFDGVKMKYGVFPYSDDKGGCHLKKHMVKTAGAGNNRLLEIIYFEEVAYSSDFPYRCSDWTNPDKLTPAQKERLDRFLENSRKDIRAAKR